MRADKLDYPSRLIDISVESAAMTTTVPLHVGEKLIVYLMHFGGLEGTVIRLFPGSFAMMISGTQRKRDKLPCRYRGSRRNPKFPRARSASIRACPPTRQLCSSFPTAALVCPLHDLSSGRGNRHADAAADSAPR